MDVRFALVVSYRPYRLLDQREAVTLVEASTIHKKAKSIRRMTTGTACFDGSKPIKLLSFLKLVKESFDDARIPEELAVPVLAHLLEGSARSFYYTRSGTGAIPSSAKRSSKFSWPHMVAALLQRYLTEDVLHQAGKALMQARQKPDQDENAFAERIEEAARDCTDDNTEPELVSAYIRGLPDTTRHLVGMKVEAKDYDEQRNLLTARRIALAVGRTVRARNMKSGSAKSTNHGATRRPTMVVPETPSTAGLGQIPSDTSVSASYMDPVLYAPQAHDELAHVMSLPSPGSSAYTDAFRASAQMLPPPAQLDITRALAPGGLGMLGTFACRIPSTLDHEVTQLAWCSVSTDEASFNFWACRTPGHSIFTCPFIPAPSRTFFAY